MISIEVKKQNVLYDNPQSNLVSRHGYFPAVVRLASGDLLALFVLGQAFESVDQTTWVSRSKDQGESWQLQGPVYDKSVVGVASSDCLKPTVLQDGQIIAIGYRFDRSNPGHNLVNPKTDGLRNGDDIIAFSRDEGRTWSTPSPICLARPELLEISGPCICIRNGDLLAGGPAFPMWDGANPSGRNGILLRSRDQGRSWSDDVLYFRSANGNIVPNETRFCQMQDGRVVSMSWAFDTDSKQNLPNHMTISHDQGLTWSDPIDTGIPGQASSLTCLGENLLLTIHAQRESDVGLYVRAIDITNDKVQVWAEKCVWNNATSQKIRSFSDMSCNLRFGQPSLVRLGDEEFLAVHWAITNGQGKILTHRLRITFA